MLPCAGLQAALTALQAVLAEDLKAGDVEVGVAGAVGEFRRVGQEHALGPCIQPTTSQCTESGGEYSHTVCCVCTQGAEAGGGGGAPDGYQRKGVVTSTGHGKKASCAALLLWA